ncbi:ATP-binding protein [Shewanella benthica]|uniref:ATP-binding protein n=1 Tax=Shewanella benthica TaxID=43661 RepID=UPI0029D41C5A|nr:ATP-binding protein [Shewanella benthica]
MALSIKEWYHMISNATIADVLLDRLIHNYHRIELGGESMRKRIKGSEALEKTP